MWSKALWITSGNPKAIPFYGNISRYRAKEFTIPGAPWQKWTSFTVCFPLELEKFPLIKCLSKNKIEGWMTFKNLLTSAWEKLFIRMEIKIMLRLPPNPCAPPRYYFWWKLKTSLKSSGSLFSVMFTFVFYTCSYYQIPLSMTILVSYMDTCLKLVVKNSSGVLSYSCCNSRTANKNPATPYKSYQIIYFPF
jgi:hypothetical protein